MMKNWSVAVFSVVCSSLLQCAAANLSSEAADDHKPLFGPFELWDVVGSLLVFFGGAFAAAAGIGGGGIYTPIFMFVMGFSVHEAVPLSKATAFGGSIANFLANFPRRAENGKTLIDYDSVMLLEPTTLFGAIIGVMLNVMSPSWFIVVVLVMVLSYTAKKAILKGMTTWKKESHTKAGDDSASAARSPMSADVTDVEDAIEMNSGPFDDDSLAVDNDASVMFSDAASISAPPSERPDTITSMSSRFPIDCFLVLLTVWSIFLLLSLLRKLVVPTCSVSYWMLTLLAVPVTIVAWYIAGKQVLKKLQKLGPSASHLQWTVKDIVVAPALAAAGGVLTSFIGVGGGMVLNPLLLEYGAVATVASATSAYTILWTASSTTLQFAIMGTLKFDYGIWFIAVGFASALAGQYALDKVLKKTGRTSIIIFLVASITIISAVLMTIIGLIQTVERARSGQSLWFRSLCNI
jgi:uncharacterized membrane protein YfcA